MFHRILVPLDGSPLAEQAMALAATVAARAGGASGGIDLLLVHSTVPGPAGVVEDGEASDRIYVTALADEATRTLGVSVTGVVLDGAPAEAIAQHADAIDADLIVMTTHGRTGISRAVLGSVADRVVRDTGRPVLLNRPIPGRRWRTAVSAGFRRILVPLDGTEEASAVLGPALDLCRWMQARPTLARVVLPVRDLYYTDSGMPPAGVVNEEATREAVSVAREALRALALHIEADQHIHAETTITVADDVGKSLVEVALRGDHDLVALMTHSRGPSRLLAGSVADRLLRDSRLPLLLLHPHPVKRPPVETELHAFA